MYNRKRKAKIQRRMRTVKLRESLVKTAAPATK